MDDGVIDEHASLGHQLFDLTQAQRVGRIPAHGHQHHLQRIAHPLDHLAKHLDHPHPVVSFGSRHQCGLIATEPKIVRGYSAALGFETEAHALRATAATHTLDHQTDIAKVQEWLGNANIATTPIYDHRKTRAEDSPTFEVAY